MNLSAESQSLRVDVRTCHDRHRQTTCQTARDIVILLLKQIKKKQSSVHILQSTDQKTHHATYMHISFTDWAHNAHSVPFEPTIRLGILSLFEQSKNAPYVPSL